MADLGTRLRAIRERKGIKQAALARELEIPPQTLSNYELGPNKVPAEMVPDIASALGVTIGELYGVEEPHTVVYGTPGSGKTNALIAQLIQALDENADRIEVNVYQGSYRRSTSTQPLADTYADVVVYLDTDVFLAAQARGLSFTRRVVEQWESIPEEEREEWRALAAAIRLEDNP